MADQNFRVKNGLDVGIGGTVITTTPSGLVGIGTTIPTTKLEINGVLGFGTFDNFGTRTNIRIGDNTTGDNLTTGYDNIFMGVGAGNSTTTGYGNNFFGLDAGYSNTTGFYNNFFGNFSGYCNTTGSNNNFFGPRAGYCNTTGSHNNFFGNEAGKLNTTGYYNNFFGVAAGFSNTTGSYNNFFGNSAGFQNTTGSHNNFFGCWAGVCNTTGCHNNFFGLFAGRFNTTGNHNFFAGLCAGYSNTTGNYNTFIGNGAGFANTTGSDNTFIGHYAGYCSTTGSCNNFFGNYAGYYNIGTNNNFFGFSAGGFSTGGSHNNFFGCQAGQFNTTGNNNNFFGLNAGRCNSTGSDNNFFGPNAGYYNTTGSFNTFFGNYAGYYNTTGWYNIFDGYYAGAKNTIGNFNTFLGSNSGISTSASYKIILGSSQNSNNLFDAPDTTKDTQFAVGVRTDANPSKYWLVGDENFNIGIGTTNPQTKLQINGVLGFGTFSAGYLNATRTNIRIGDTTTGANLTTSGFDNIFMGIGAGNSNTTGCNNNFFGLQAGFSNTSGTGNNFFGVLAGYYNTTGRYNNFFGYVGYRNTTGSYNNFFGVNAGEYNTTGSNNNFFGSYAGYCNTTGCYNNFFGNSAGHCNTTGESNTFFGKSAGYNNTTGCYNNFFGYEAGCFNTTGCYNNFFNQYAGYSNTTGNNNNFFGNGAGYYNTTGNFNTFLGSFTGISTSASNKIILGRGYDFFTPFDAPDTTKDTQFAVGVRTDANPSKYWLVGDENFNIGIGTTNPTQKLHVGGNLRVTGGLYDSNNNVGTAGSVLSSTGSGISWIPAPTGGSSSWSKKTTTYTAVTGDQLIADTSGGSFTITLPASPTTGNSVKIADGADWETNPLTVARNGSTIDGIADDFVLNIKGITVDFIYDGSTWEVFANTGPEGKEALWTKVTTNTQAYSRDRLLADASGGTFTITLPNAGTGRTTGSFVRILDGGDWSTTGVTVARNGATIEGIADDMFLNIGGIEVEFAYDGTTWNVYPSIGAANQVATIEDLTSTTLYPVMVAGVGTGYTARINTPGFVFDAANSRLGIGTTNPTSKLTVLGDVSVSGVITCTDLNSTSDANLKTNIQKLNNSIEILKKINPVSFNWKDTNKKSYGVIAQELEKVLPELIGEMNGHKTVSYTPLIALMIDAILELNNRIEN